jgi:hypothetical protein
MMAEHQNLLLAMPEMAGRYQTGKVKPPYTHVGEVICD